MGSHFEVTLNVAVSIKVKCITGESETAAIHAALAVVEPQLEHLFDRKVSASVEMFYAGDIPAVMVDRFGKEPTEGDEPILTAWRRIDVPEDEAAVFAAAEKVVELENSAVANAFALDNTLERYRASASDLRSAFIDLPPVFDRAAPAEESI